MAKWIENLGKQEPTRKGSNKQETALAKSFGGKKTSNSGARFGQNDIKTPELEIEAKTTVSKGYRITIAELKAIEKKTVGGRIPVQVIEFSSVGSSYVILPLPEFEGMMSRLKEKDS